MVVDHGIHTVEDIAEEELFDEHRVHDQIEQYDMQEVCAYCEQSADLCMRYTKGSDAHLLWTNWHKGSATFRAVGSIQEFVHIVSQLPIHHARDSVAELCGGAARVSMIVARRQRPTGESFDLLTGFD